MRNQYFKLICYNVRPLQSTTLAAMINLRSETLSVKSSPSFNLTVLAKRYTLELPYTLSDDPKTLSLIFCHAQGFFKEVWEPVIQRLPLHVNESSEVKDVLKIKEIYSIESPNHGESATLNEEALDKYYLDSCTSIIVI